MHSVGVLGSGLGNVGDHWGGGEGERNQHPPLSAGHRSGQLLSLLSTEYLLKCMFLCYICHYSLYVVGGPVECSVDVQSASI